nr:uncharacterized protein LOC129256483 isoform X2 [Lytechinus pictus]
MLLFVAICNKVDLNLTRFIHQDHSTYVSVAASRDIGGGIARIANPPKKAQASKDTGFALPELSERVERDLESERGEMNRYEIEDYRINYFEYEQDTCLLRRQPHRVWSLVSRVWRTQIPTHLVRRRARTLTSKTHSREF